MLAEDLRTYLVNHTSVKALVGNRIFPLTAELGVEFPCITYEREGVEDVEGHSGSVGLSIADFTFRCYSTEYSQAEQVANAVKNSLKGFRGLLGLSNIHTIVATNDEADEYTEYEGRAEGVYAVPLLVKIYYYP